MGTVRRSVVHEDRKRPGAACDRIGKLSLNVRVNRPAEAGAVSLVRDDAPCAADQAYGACRNGSG